MSAQAAGRPPLGAGPGGTNPEGTPAGPAAAEIYLRLIAEAELRQRPVISGPGPHPHRVWLAAATLAAAGALGPDVAWHVVSEFETSAGLRGGDVRPVISSLHRPHWARQARPGQYRARPQRARQHRGQPGAGEAGPGISGTRPAGDEPDAPSAIQVGATLPLPPEQEGWYGEFCLLSLARTQSQAALAVAARWAGQTRRTAGPRPRHAPFHQVGAVDDRGVSYRAALWDMGAEDGRDWWDGHLGLDPAPPPDTRWLEVGPGAQGQRVRIDLATPPGRALTLAEPVPPVSPAARLLDQMGDDLLTLESARTGASARMAPRVTQVIQDLIGSGTLPARTSAVARLAGLGWRLGRDLGPGGPVPARALPPRRSPAGRRAGARRAGRGGAVRGRPAGDRRRPVRARRIAIGRRGVTLHVMASGWEPRGHGWLVHGSGPGDTPPDLSLSWRARDSTGRWHLVSGMSWGAASQTRGMVKMYLTPRCIRRPRPWTSS